MKKALKIFVITTLIILISILIGTILFLGVIRKEVDKISLDKDKLMIHTMQINVYDSSGNQINSSNCLGQKIISIDKVKNDTIDAFVSIEDKSFYSHKGINEKRIVKALINNLLAGKIVEGASTITQQLIKNTHLSSEKTLRRKIKEIYLAKKLEQKYSKQEIMEMYLNAIYFGNGYYGIESAANNYFGVTANELTLDQSALLAAVIKAPKTFDPINHYDTAIKRRNLVLNEMLKDGKITSEQYDENVQKQTEIIHTENSSDVNASYVTASIDEACKILNTTEKNILLNQYKIYTYLDTDKQSKVFESINDNDFYEQNTNGNTPDGLALVINNETGGVEALAQKSKYNLSSVKRQPGSAIKPILVYAPALEYGHINPLSQIKDESIDIDGYTPHNVSGESNQYVSITQSVAKSLNIPAIKTMQYVGIDKSKNFASAAGIEFDEQDNGYAIALGGFTTGTTLTELAGSYLPFARQGNYVQPGLIKKITTANGLTIYQKDEVGKQIMGSDTAYLMTDILKASVNTGTSKRLNTLPYEVAGKTGTVAVKGTNYNTDAVSIAYTSEHIVATTLFDYSNAKEYYLEGSNNGGTYCTSIVKSIMQNIYKDAKPSDFVVPDTVSKIKIDSTQLQDNHAVVCASTNTPPKYVIEAYFSNRYLPSDTSTKFDEPNVEFNVQYIDSNAVISANLLDCFSYELYCNGNLIDSVSDYNGEYIFKQKNLTDNTMYNYYFIVKNDYANIENKSKQLSIITKNRYEQIIDNQLVTPGISWYFGQ